MLGRVEDFFEIKFLKAMILPVFVSHNHILFPETDGFGLLQVEGATFFFSLTIKFCVDSKNEITEDLYFTPKSFFNLPHVG